MKIAIVRNKNNVEYFHDKSITYLCLTLDSYHFAKKTGNNVLYAYKFNQIHDTDYYKVARILSYEYLNYFYKELKLKDDEKAYLVSRIINFFATTVFDYSLAKSIVNNYKKDYIYCFSEKNVSLVKGGSSPNNGFYYFVEILKTISNDTVIDLHCYNENVTNKDRVNKINSLLIKAKKFKYYLMSSVGDLSFFLNNRNESFLHSGGIRGSDAELVKNLNLKGFKVVSNTGNTIIKTASKILSFIYYKNNTAVIHKLNKIESGILAECRELLYKNDNIFSNAFIELEKLVRSYCLEKSMYVYFYKRNLPLAVISQNNSTQILAANSLNINTFHISHGIVVTPELSPMFGRYNYLSSKVQSDYHSSVNMVFNNIVKIPPAHISTKSEEVKNISKSEDHRVILLAKNMGMRRWEFDDYNEYFLLCESVVNATKDFECNLLVKIHPSGGRHMLNIYKSLDIFKYPHVSISISEDYMDELKESSIVVSMQDSSAIFQAVCKERLVIFPTSHYSKPYKSNLMIDYISSNTISPKNIHELDESLRSILNNREGYYSALEKQKSTFKANITCASKSEISKEISDHIIKNI
jgi:hypothetical protein